MLNTQQIEAASLKSGLDKKLIAIHYHKNAPAVIIGEIENYAKNVCWTSNGYCFIDNERRSEHDLIVTP